jgi:hypothetical protein
MKNFCWMRAVIFGWLFLLACGAGWAGDAVAELDGIAERHWERRGVMPNEPVSDEVFLKRVYLDVVGRLPGVDEARDFLLSEAEDKRGVLIDRLLASAGAASHAFHFFADLLRVQTQNRDGVTGQAYAAWLRQALVENRPYDEMVRQLITAEGGLWDTGAIGFYMRDRGMPLDHLSAAVQVFLGTRIECAQCHNHPFDRWSQMEYYQMAAFTYGMDTRSNYLLRESELGAVINQGIRRGDAATRQTMQMVRRSLGDIAKPLRYTQVENKERVLKLPHDYQYDDAKPHDVVGAATMFGHQVQVEGGEAEIEAFARWMTSPENPRFTRVIANRLWKRVMGVGLIEPVDEMMDSTVPASEEMMAFLERTMVEVGYDLRAFMRVLLNSGVYQRMPSEKGVELGEVYHFPGPLVRRLSAEQIWDSVVTMIAGDRDDGIMESEPGLEKRVATLNALHDALANLDPEVVFASSAVLAGANAEIEAEIKALTKQAGELRKAGEKAEARAIGQQVSRLRKEQREGTLDAVLGEEQARSIQVAFRESGKVEMNKNARRRPMAQPITREEFRKMMEEGKSRREIKAMVMEMKEAEAVDPVIRRLEPLVRASQLPSPAPRGHFLRVFGQSDRETIENANLNPSVPQALHFLNGPVADALLARGSALGALVRGMEAGEELWSCLYLAVLSRFPSSEELELLSGSGDLTAADVLHALLNTTEFVHVR